MMTDIFSKLCVIFVYFSHKFITILQMQRVTYNKILSTNSSVTWDKRNDRLKHDYAITAWLLSLLPEICSDISKNIDREKGLIVECII